jgi:hypothetical protein
LDENAFDYIVTPDHFPAALNITSLEQNSIQCFTAVEWRSNSNYTVIILDVDNDRKAEAIREHELGVVVRYTKETSSSLTWAKRIIYQCNTDHDSMILRQTILHLCEIMFVCDQSFEYNSQVKMCFDDRK